MHFFIYFTQVFAIFTLSLDNQMNHIIDLNTFSLPGWISLAGSFLVALIITWLSIPTIVKISKHKKLNAHINDRTSHINDTPNLGGIAVFSGVALSIVIFSLRLESDTVKFLIGGMLLIFFIGVKDDILIIDPKKKMIGQVIACLLVVWLGNVRITDFHHALEIGSISPFFSIIFTVFVFVLLINGFNLIDGIDGLASGLGIIISLVYGIWFIITGHISAGVISFGLAGSLIAFFRFNIFSRTNKIFLGDTGSMITGLVIAFLTVEFIEYNLSASAEYRLSSAPAVAYGMLIVPLIDLLRVFILRSWNGTSPFKADRNHIHHTLLSLGCSHLGATLILIGISLAFIVLTLLLRNTGVVKLMTILTAMGFIVLSIPWVILKTGRKRAN